jgi:hypothetical protein
MGLGDLIDGLGDAIEGGFDDVVNGGKHLIGTAVDDGAHVLGDGLNAVGLHGAAQAVDNFGDSAADHLGDQVAEKQLGQTTDPTQLVHGDLNAIQTAAARLGTFGSAFHETAQGLAGIDTTHWQGQAADGFRAHYQQHPKQWGTTADACTTAASAWNTYGDAVLSAQQQARKAITLYQQGTQATAQAQAHYNQAVATFAQQANAYNAAAAQGQDPGPMPQAPAAFTDPGASARTQAQQILTTARQQRDTAGSQAQQAITHAASTFPAVPAFTQRMFDDASDTLTTASVEGEHLVGGVAKGVGSMVKFVRGVDPLDPYNVTHPANYIDHMSQTAAGLVHVALHPQDLVTGLIGSGWSSDPAQALGELIPNVVAAVGTDGVSGAAEGAMDAGKVAEVAGDTAANAGRTAAEDLGSVDRSTGTAAAHGPDPAPAPAPPPAQSLAQPAARPAEHAMTDMTGPTGVAGDIAPHSPPDLSGADHAAAGQIDSAGGGLSNIEARLNGLQDHIHPDAATTPSAMPSESPLAHVHQAPVLPATSSATQLSAADAAAARGFDAAGGDLSAAEQDLAGVQVHNPGVAAEDAGLPGFSGTLDSPPDPLGAGPGPLASDPRVQADLAQTAMVQPDLEALDQLNENFVWRRDNGNLYRTGNRGTAAFTDGSTPGDIDNIDFPSHLDDNGLPDAYTSTTTNPKHWEIWGSGAKYFYDIDAPGGIDVNATLGEHPHSYENEIAMPGGIKGERYRGLWPIERDPKTLKVKLGEYVRNPHYRPLH